MLKALRASLLLALFPVIADAQTAFYAHYGIADSDYGSAVIATPDGGYALIHQTEFEGNFLPQVIKTDCNGNIEWTKALRSNSVTSAYSLVNVGTGMALLLSFTDGVSGGRMTSLVRLGSMGELLWSTTLPLRSHNTNGCLVVEEDGFVICGDPGNDPQNVRPTPALVRLDLDGNVIGAMRIQLPDLCMPTGLTRLSTGGYVVVCTYRSPNPRSIFKDIALVLTDAAFVPQRAILYGTTFDDEAMGITSIGEDVYVCGRSYVQGHAWDGFLLRADRGLARRAVTHYDSGTQQGEAFQGIAPLPGSRGLMLCGDRGSFDERIPLLARIDSEGNVVSCTQYDISPGFTNYFFAVAATADGGAVMTGDIRPPTMYRDAPLLRTDSLGNDECHAQAVTLDTYVPSYNSTLLGVTGVPFFIAAADVALAEEDIAIHQVVVCGTAAPCTAFTFEAVTQCPSRCFDFHDGSAGGDAWLWTFPGGSPAMSTAQHPQGICYAVDGTYPVTLTVTNSATGGRSVLRRDVAVVTGCDPVFPNIITPDGNGSNDVFHITALPVDYELKIFNRWGTLINEFTRPGEYWKGTGTDGARVPQGVYYYTYADRINERSAHGWVQVAY